MTEGNKQKILDYRKENEKSYKGSIPARPSYRSRKRYLLCYVCGLPVIDYKEEGSRKSHQVCRDKKIAENPLSRGTKDV